MGVLQFVRRSFNPDEVAILGQAFDKACQELYDSVQPVSLEEIIAKRLIMIAARGETDPERMCEAALISVGLRPVGPINAGRACLFDTAHCDGPIG